MNFSKRSFHFAIFSLVLLLAFLVLSVTARDGSTRLDDVVGYMITLFFVTVVIGFFCALLGWREPNSTQKMVGLVVNIGLMVLLVVNVLQNLATIEQLFS